MESLHAYSYTVMLLSCSYVAIANYLFNWYIQQLQMQYIYRYYTYPQLQLLYVAILIEYLYTILGVAPLYWQFAK